MVVSIERWRAVSNPLASPIWKTETVIILIWIASSLLSLPEPFTLKIYPADYARKGLDTTVRFYSNYYVKVNIFYPFLQLSFSGVPVAKSLGVTSSNRNINLLKLCFCSFFL